jgi:ubiquinone/menaquinone biosynthesis C-methylase UbiE
MSADAADRGSLTAEIAAHYASGYEATRLEQGWSRLEEARTREILARYLPRPPAVVLDVAGAAGPYAFWLADRGYRVHLRDALPLHVEMARRAASERSGAPLLSIAVGDARRLDQPDGSVDAVLLLGPLYHLTEPADRLGALGEARRVLRPGGVAFVVGVSRFASLLDGLREGYLDDPDFASIVEGDLRDGQHRNPSGNPAYWTTAFLHHPDELVGEVSEAGLTVERCLAVEGPTRAIRDFEAWWADPERRERLMALLRLVEAEPTLLGASPHLLVVARRGGVRSPRSGKDRGQRARRSPAAEVNSNPLAAHPTSTSGL